MSLSQEIDNKINIVDVVSRYISVKKAWVNFKALCPFHNEKTPSFLISPTKNIAYCFSCHHWGWPIKFVSEIEKIPYWEALQKMAKEAGVELKTDFYKEHNENRGDLYELHKIVADFYEQDLLKEENRAKLKYLTDRWLSLETIKKFKLWYSWDPRNLFYKLKEKWYQEKDILDSGVFISAYKDKFFWRITFPISDFTGNVVAFTWRVLDNSLPKYLNSPTTKIFDKSSILYWLNLAKSEISKRGYVIIVEWQMDTISLHQAGFNNTVAISGTALTEEQIKLLRRFSKTIYLSLDNDSAWINATFQSLANTINTEIDIKIINFGTYKDPDEYLKAGNNFEDAVKSALSPVSFYLKEWEKKYDINSIQWKKTLVKDVFQFLKRITSRIEVDIYMKEISNFLWLSMDILYEEFKNTRIKKPEDNNEIIENLDDKIDIYEEIIAYLHLYNYFDLFLEKFVYNIEDIEAWDSIQILKKYILQKEGLFEYDGVDVDRIKSIELFIEENNSSLNKEAIKKKFLDLVFKLQKQLFDQERKIIDEQMKKDPENTEYLQNYMELIKKWKQLWILR